MKVRYLIKYSKGEDIKFISHLDLMRTIQRIIRRSQLPVEYSKGFNPHITLSIAQPLSVGVYSDGEYMDVVFNEEVDEKIIIERLNANCPVGVKFFDAVKIINNPEGKKKPQAMAAIDMAEYVISFQLKDNYDENKAMAEIDELLKKATWETLKKTKSGEKTVDIKKQISKLNKDNAAGEGKLSLRALVSCGSKDNLSASLLGEYIVSNTSFVKEDSFVDIKRINLYAYLNKKLLPLNEYLVRV